MKDTEYQSLHCTLNLGIWRVPFNRPESPPENVIDCSGQVLKVFNEELLWIRSIERQWLHHGEHLTHIWFRPLEYALKSFSVKWTTFLEEFTRSGQAGELNDIECIGFVMDIAGHPLQGPSLRISVVSLDV